MTGPTWLAGMVRSSSGLPRTRSRAASWLLFGQLGKQPTFRTVARVLRQPTNRGVGIVYLESAPAAAV
jgi:hypothetical protein